MFTSDIHYILQWWLILFVVGIICLPLATFLFSNFFDRGYIFSKILGTILLSYGVLILGLVHVITFNTPSVIFVLLILGVGNLFILLKKPDLLFQIWSSPPSPRLWRVNWKIIVFEEIVFFLGLLYWSFIRGNAPDIHGLEKYMDFGFVNSILRSTYFPPKDMWYPPFPINYYYFGHFVTAVLTKLSNIPSLITFNLMIATLFSFTFVGSFSIGINLIQGGRGKGEGESTVKRKHFLTLNPLPFTLTIGGLLIAFLTAFAGNLHTIYTFFKPYDTENPVPPWALQFLPKTFPNSYWYPNATRFIYHTIHEFPIYSFVVSDLHGHVLDIPFVLLTIALLLSIFLKFDFTLTILHSIVIGFLLAVMYMTNAWDGLIYFLFAIFIFLSITSRPYLENISGSKIDYYLKKILFNRDYIFQNVYFIIIMFISFFLFSLPFSLFFKPFASQIGILCAPGFLTNIGHFGPLLFEKDHCQHSLWWQLLTLHGFFLFWVVGFVVFLIGQRKKNLQADRQVYAADFFVLLMSVVSLLLIILPEFVYLKDIYPAHYRANTMFKLVYQSFIMLSIASGYILVRAFSVKGQILRYYDTRILGEERKNGKKPSPLLISQYLNILISSLFWIIGLFVFVLVAMYPYFAINSYYGNLQTYYGLDGTKYLQRQYPADYDAILWLNKNVSDQPVILEAQGDSYTDYARVSANTGLPTVLGWTVHEWLWRGSYNPLPERIGDIQTIYTTEDPQTAKRLLDKYHVLLVFIGNLEHQKYPTLNQNKFSQLGKVLYQNGQTIIYQIQ